MKAETTLRLANEFDNVVAVKEASGDFDQVKAIVEGAPEGFCVYSGDDSATYDIMKLGGVGVISTIGNVAPSRMKEIVDLCAAGKWDEAAAANGVSCPHGRLFQDSEPHPGQRGTEAFGFPVGGVRLPMVDRHGWSSLPSLSAPCARSASPLQEAKRGCTHAAPLRA